jgi:hypothetical protein
MKENEHATLSPDLPEKQEMTQKRKMFYNHKKQVL